MALLQNFWDMNVFEMTPENITGKAKDRGYMHYFGKQRPGKKDSD